jgi:hypothetical protein
MKLLAVILTSAFALLADQEANPATLRALDRVREQTKDTGVPAGNTVSGRRDEHGLQDPG